MVRKYGKWIRLAALLIVVVLVIAFVACQMNQVGDAPDTTQSPETSLTPTGTLAPTGSPGPADPSEEVKMQVTAETIAQLYQYPNLKKADLSGSDCYAEIMAFADANPKIEVIYTVSVGTKAVGNTVTYLSLTDTDFEYNTLKANLKYLPKVSSVALNQTKLTEKQINDLKTTYPQIVFTVTTYNGSAVPTAPVEPVITDTKVTLDSSWPVYDWTGRGAGEVNASIEEAKSLAAPCVVKLSGSWSKADVKKLQTAAPGVLFDYSFTLYGKTLSTLSKTVSYVNANIGDSGAPAIREALDILTRCTHFKLDNCKLTNEVLAQIRDDYKAQTEIVWRIFHYYPNSTSTKSRSWLTDTTVLRAVYHVDDSNSYLFKYLTKVKYVDLGHNTTMRDLSFLGYMPDLELAILSGSPITDLSPLANCKKLDFLELAWCGSLSNIAPLAQCPSLKFLNLSYTRVKDLSPVKNLPLEMLCYINSGNYPGLTTAYWGQVQSWLPKCWITCDPMHGIYADGTSASPYGVGWRYKANWGGYTDCYKKVRVVFNLDYIDSLLQSGAK